MIKQAKDILIIMLLLFVAWHFFSDKDTPKERVVIKTEIVKIPPIIGKSDIIFNIKPIKLTKTHFKEVHLEEWERQQLIDSVEHYMTERLYEKVLLVDNDDISIWITARTKGVLNSVFAEYQIKQKQIEIQNKETTLLPRRILMGVQLTAFGLEHPSLAMSLGYQNRKGNVLYGGLNSNGAVLFGYHWNVWQF